MKSFIQSSGIKRKVLVVDDEFINRELLRAMLSRQFEVSVAENGEQALEMMRGAEPAFSLVLLDLMMPVKDGFEVLRVSKADEHLKSTPIIVMTSEKAAEVKSIHMGAADFITKPFNMPDVVLARCRRIIELSEDRHIISFTERDSVTGLYSKEYFFEYIRQLQPRIDMKMDAVALNLERFRFVNELHGREAGDKLLRKTAELIEEHIIAARGIACRREADLFLVYREHCEDYEPLLERINSALSEDAHARNTRLRAGVVRCVSSSVPAEGWFDRAKTASDHVRGDYNRCVEVYSEKMHEDELLRERLIGDVSRAIAQKHLRVYYQPKYRIQGGEPRLSSAEALIRWQHPELGMLSPAVFIPLFEENGLIRQVDYYVWREAAAQVSRWKEKYGVSVPVSVNVSRIDLFDPELESKLTGLLGEFGLSVSELIPEITESAYADNAEQMIKVVNGLRERGFMIEMDDFGSGYSSLNMLTSIPIDVLKMDMQFIRNMFRDKKSLRLVELVMDIARFLRVPVVAEGVEEDEQLGKLRDMGCEMVQGYYFSPPLPPEKFSAFIEKEITAGRAGCPGCPGKQTKQQKGVKHDNR